MSDPDTGLIKPSKKRKSPAIILRLEREIRAEPSNIFRDTNVWIHKLIVKTPKGKKGFLVRGSVHEFEGRQTIKKEEFFTNLLASANFCVHYPNAKSWSRDFAEEDYNNPGERKKLNREFRYYCHLKRQFNRLGFEDDDIQFIEMDYRKKMGE